MINRKKIYIKQCLIAFMLLFFYQPAFAEIARNLTEGTAGDFLSSRFARQSGDLEKAASLLEKTAKNNSENTDMLSQLLVLQMAAGKMKQALATAEKLQQLKSGDPLSGLLLTTEKIRLNDFDSAYNSLSEYFAESNTQLWLPLLEAWIEAGQKKQSKPLTIEEMPAVAGRTATILNYHIALINEYNGFNDAAALAFSEAAIEQNMPSARIMQHIKRFAGNNAGKYNKKNNAIVDLETIISESSDEKITDLLSLESPVITPSDGIAEILHTMGIVMKSAGINQDAAAYLRLAHYLRPDLHSATYNLAEIFAESGIYKSADALFKLIPAESQYAMKAYLRRASLLNRAGKYEESIALFKKLTDDFPTASEPWIARGDVLRARKSFSEAAASYSEAISLSGVASTKDWAVYYARGACYEQLGKWREAKADLNKAIELNPDQPDVLNYLGYGMIIRGEDIEKATKMLELAVSQSPDDPQILDSFGWALHLIGRFDEALNYLERAVEMLPNDVVVNDHLGDNYWRLGRKNEARFQWKRAISYHPAEDEIKKINAKLLSGLPEHKSPEPYSPQSAELKPATSN